MTLVRCDLDYCLNNVGRVCQLDEVYVFPQGYEVCENMNDITAGADYKSVFYKIIKNNENNTIVKEKCEGKRIEHDGLVFYTMWDYRREDAPLTEETSGLLACYIADLKDVAKMELVKLKVAEHLKTHKPVIEHEDKPEAGLW